MSAGLANVVVGIWLVSSAFLWVHAPAQFAVSFACGAFAGVMGLVGLELRWPRYLNVTVGLVLVSAAANLRPGRAVTLTNDLICGLLVLAFSFWEGGGAPRRARAK